MSDSPIAYHFTFGTYGNRLHGDERGTVDKRRNKYGDPIIGQNEHWHIYKQQLLKYQPILLTEEQRHFVQSNLPIICQRGDWAHHCSACQNNHIHIMLSTSKDIKAVRSWMKRWLGESLSDKYPLPQNQSWWAEGGSIKWIWDDFYLDAVHQYIIEQRA